MGYPIKLLIEGRSGKGGLYEFPFKEVMYFLHLGESLKNHYKNSPHLKEKLKTINESDIIIEEYHTRSRFISAVEPRFNVIDTMETARDAVLIVELLKERVEYLQTIVAYRRIVKRDFNADDDEISELSKKYLDNSFVQITDELVLQLNEQEDTFSEYLLKSP